MLIVRCTPRYLPERKYILDVLLCDFLHLEYRLEFHETPALHILSANPDSTRSLRVADQLFHTADADWLTARSLPNVPLPRCTLPPDFTGRALPDVEIPLIYGRPTENGNILCERDKSVDVGVDIFGSAFFMLTRYEELARPQHDQHGRYRSGASLAARERFLERPLINEYLELLWLALSWLDPTLARKPRQHRVLLSHDVDRPLLGQESDSWRTACRKAREDLIARRSLADAARRIRAHYQARRHRPARDPYNTFDYLMDLSERYGLTSSFNFMTGATHPDFDPDCQLHTPFMQDLLSRIISRGHEIGFHPSYGTIDDPSQAHEESMRLRRIMETVSISPSGFGGRQHYLRWRNPDTWRMWEEFGADYDSTLGYADRVGFRCGVCYEYPVFDLQARTRLRLRERPLVVMDTTLLNYASLKLEESLAWIVRMNNTCSRFGGDFTLLVHNSTLFSGIRRRWYADVIRSIAPDALPDRRSFPGLARPETNRERCAA
jgi:hypothetical protein